MTEKNKISADEAWRLLFEKYDIVNKVAKDNIFHIKASQIKEFKEPRLMSKWDSSDQLPSILKMNKINILPDSRSSYILGDFLLYEDIPELNEHVTKMTSIEIPDYETIDINNITSEANAINILVISRILDDFLDTEENVSTFNGRMGTGVFEFKVDTHRKKKQHIIVNNAQCEIDGGFENDDSVIIMEAKNVLHKDFHIRQLYYPYRLWSSKVNKPIRLIFSIYSNKIYRLFEYEFEDIYDYSSIKLVKSKNYSLQDTEITLQDLIEVRKKNNVIYDDNQNIGDKPPFIQANSFERVISLLENMYDNPMNDEEIADLMHFGSNVSNGKPNYRQSQYYYNAGKYLGLFEKIRTEENEVKATLTKLGRKIYKMQYKESQLKLVSLMLEHQIFSSMFDYVITSNGELPESDLVQQKMREFNVCNNPQIARRATSVRSWTKWMFNLIKL